MWDEKGIGSEEIERIYIEHLAEQRNQEYCIRETNSDKSVYPILDESEVHQLGLFAPQFEIHSSGEGYTETFYDILDELETKGVLCFVHSGGGYAAEHARYISRGLINKMSREGREHLAVFSGFRDAVNRGLSKKVSIFKKLRRAIAA